MNMCNLCIDKKQAAVKHAHPARRSFLRAAGTLPLWAGAMGSTSFLPSALAADASPKPENVLTPDAALERLLAGNKRFVEGGVIKNQSFKNIPATLRSGQNPYACILSCADSRVGPELCFDEGQGDLFVARLAGNYVNTDMLASLEYGALMLKSPLIMVLGHTECGAISAAIKAEKDNVDFPGHIQVIASKLDQAVRLAKPEGGKRTTEVAKENVRLNVAELRKSTPILRKLVDAGQLKIVGGLYDLETGKVSLVV
jgi:carbonic anhydrase